MSLDGGYIGSLDHAIANLHIGRRRGISKGLRMATDRAIKTATVQAGMRRFRRGTPKSSNKCSTPGTGPQRKNSSPTNLSCSRHASSYFSRMSPGSHVKTLNCGRKTRGSKRATSTCRNRPPATKRAIKKWYSSMRCSCDKPPSVLLS